MDIARPNCKEDGPREDGQKKMGRRRWAKEDGPNKMVREDGPRRVGVTERARGPPEKEFSLAAYRVRQRQVKNRTREINTHEERNTQR